MKLGMVRCTVKSLGQQRRYSFLRTTRHVIGKGWIMKPTPKSMGMKGKGWFYEFTHCLVDKDENYCVMIRKVATEWGVVEHCCMRNAESTDIPWAEKQRIKNELFGDFRTAVEVFPAEADLVDAAMMYHFWVLPVDMSLPFTLKA